MEKNKFSGLTKEELIRIINTYEEKLAINEECRELLRIDSRCI